MQSRNCQQSYSQQFNATYQIRHQTRTTNISVCLLRWLGLLLSLDDRDQRNVYLQEVALARSPPQLTHGLDEWGTLNISNGTTQLNDAHIRSLIRVINRLLRNLLDPILDCICEMWHDLNRLSQVGSCTFPLNDMLVYLASGNVVLALEGNVEVSLVVSEIQINLSSIVKDEDFTVSVQRLELVA